MPRVRAAATGRIASGSASGGRGSISSHRAQRGSKLTAPAPMTPVGGAEGERYRREQQEANSSGRLLGEAALSAERSDRLGQLCGRLR